MVLYCGENSTQEQYPPVCIFVFVHVVYIYTQEAAAGFKAKL